MNTSTAPVPTELRSPFAAPSFDIAGRVAVITGAGQGIGREYARAFAAAGARVVVADLNHEAAHQVAAAIGAAGGDAMACAVDVADDDAVTGAVGNVVGHYGGVDILINNAAVFSTMMLRGYDEIPLAEWDRTLRVNITGSYLFTRKVAPLMRRAGYGRIINVSSVSVWQGLEQCLHYTTSKSAVTGMTYSLARELGPLGITVNAIAPGGTQTEVPRATQTEEGRALMLSRQCIKRRQTPADLTGLALFLASPAASFITGQVIACDGGSLHR